MEYIQKSIYSRPEIRCRLNPLWSAWVLVAIGALCGLVFFVSTELSEGLTSILLAGIVVGAVSLLTVVCYWLFGDSRRPWHRELHEVLEPIYDFYPLSAESQLIAALEANDEKALNAVKRQIKPDLALVRYVDKQGRVCYSQLTRVEGDRYIPLTDIYVNVSDNQGTHSTLTQKETH